MMRKQFKSAFFGGLILFLIIVAFVPVVAQANGGTIVLTEDKGPFNVTVIASPSPPQPGVPLHLNVLLTKASSPQRVTDATVIFDPSMPGMEMPGSEKLRHYPGVTPNTYDVDIPVSMEGLWRINITIISPQFGQTSFPIDVTVKKPEAPWLIVVLILIGLPIMAGLTWFFLFRKSDDDDDEEDTNLKSQKTGARSKQSEI